MPAIDEQSISIIEEEVGRTGGAEGFGHLLCFIKEVREGQLMPSAEGHHLLGTVIRVRCNVVAVDRHQTDVRVSPVMAQPRQTIAQMHDEGAVVADEHDQRATGAGALGR